jgi:hypothetical protein
MIDIQVPASKALDGASLGDKVNGEKAEWYGYPVK